jgi:sirohydrochlorin ferrochelatase
VSTRGRDPALREAVLHRRCRLDVEAGRPAEAVGCYERLRRALPRGSRDAEALLSLASLAAQLGDCARARAWAAELGRDGRLRAEDATQLAERMAACGR